MATTGPSTAANMAATSHRQRRRRALAIDGHDALSPVRAAEVRVAHPLRELAEQTLLTGRGLARSILARVEKDLDRARVAARIDDGQTQSEHSQQLDHVPSAGGQSAALRRHGDVHLRRQRQLWPRGRVPIAAVPSTGTLSSCFLSSILFLPVRTPLLPSLLPLDFFA
jgi:hypothetical protein